MCDIILPEILSSQWWIAPLNFSCWGYCKKKGKLIISTDNIGHVFPSGLNFQRAMPQNNNLLARPPEAINLATYRTLAPSCKNGGEEYCNE